MWKRIAVASGLLFFLVALGLVGAGTLFAVKAFKPEWMKPDIRLEFRAMGVAIGESTSADIIGRFGAPEHERQESNNIVYEYPSRGLLLRLDRASGKLTWYEFNTRQFTTGKGVTVGATSEYIASLYGPPSHVARLMGGSRIRYAFGQVYALEFWLNKEDRVEKVVFFKA